MELILEHELLINESVKSKITYIIDRVIQFIRNFQTRLKNVLVQHNVKVLLNTVSASSDNGKAALDRIKLNATIVNKYAKSLNSLATLLLKEKEMSLRDGYDMNRSINVSDYDIKTGERRDITIKVSEVQKYIGLLNKDLSNVMNQLTADVNTIRKVASTEK